MAQDNVEEWDPWIMSRDRIRYLRRRSKRQGWQKANVGSQVGDEVEPRNLLVKPKTAGISGCESTLYGMSEALIPQVQHDMDGSSTLCCCMQP